MNRVMIAALLALLALCCGLWWASRSDPAVEDVGGAEHSVGSGGSSQGEAPPHVRDEAFDAGTRATVAVNPTGPLAGVLAMHVQQAPADLQRTYAVLAERERSNFQAQADAIAADPNDGVESYLNYLVNTRAARVRMLAHQALLMGEGVLVLDGLDEKLVASHIAGCATVRYLGVSTYFGRQADLLVAVRSSKEELAELTSGIKEVAMGGLREFVNRFNSLPLQERQEALSREKSGAPLPGLTKDVAFFVGDLIERHPESAILTIGS
jgi:hypothetical protein